MNVKQTTSLVSILLQAIFSSTLAFGLSGCKESKPTIDTSETEVVVEKIDTKDAPLVADVISAPGGMTHAKAKTAPTEHEHVIFPEDKDKPQAVLPAERPPKEEKPKPPAPKPEPPKEKPQAPPAPPPPVAKTAPEPPEPPEEEAVEIQVAVSEGENEDDDDDEEFERSTENVNVTKEAFNTDKSDILKIIGDLEIIMDDKDVKAWLNCIDVPSKEYWSDKRNLLRASNKLPNKQIKLRNIEDYFNYIFIPSRKGHKIEEIRYVSTQNIKAVQTKKNKNDPKKRTDVVYYNFVKVNGQWLIKLPPLK